MDGLDQSGNRAEGPHENAFATIKGIVHRYQGVKASRPRFRQPPFPLTEHYFYDNLRLHVYRISSPARQADQHPAFPSPPTSNLRYGD